MLLSVALAAGLFSTGAQCEASCSLRTARAKTTVVSGVLSRMSRESSAPTYRQLQTCETGQTK